MNNTTEPIKKNQDNKTEKKSKKFFEHFMWWPHYIVISTVVMVLVTLCIILLSNAYPVPDDAPAEFPFPDAGVNIPGPEWIFLLLWTPFWYFAGSAKKYLFIMPLVPLFLTAFFIFLPYVHKIPFGKIPGLGSFLEKIRNRQTGITKSFLYAIPAIVFSVTLIFSVYQSGHQAKVLGCESCHNSAMGVKMGTPPLDVAKYYTVDRAMQIKSAKYRAGKTKAGVAGGGLSTSSGGEEGYKNANWQMRHMYEPTFTW